MRLHVISGKEMIKILTKQGFQTVRQKVDHVSLYKKSVDETLLVVVPLQKEIKKGTLLNILRQAKITREEFEKML